ncbi:MAG: diaminopimelate decarboxylase [Butyrivibrio sp.]|nr:diaminopimelate decarboxylase [Butyrivibrio sp.]
MITPCYTIHLNTFEKNCFDIMNAFETKWQGNVKYGYSVKTNHDAGLMRYAYEKLDWYIETVSPDEYKYGREMGFDAQRTIFNGPCKKDMLKKALEEGAYINLDNLSEVAELCDICMKSANLIKREVLESRIGIRVNFNLEAECPGETTAQEEVSRFGICCENGDFARAVSMLRTSGIELSGLHMHTSTKTRSVGVFRALAAQVSKLVKQHNLKLKYVDIGGGYFGGQVIHGKPTMEQYADAITSELKKSISPQNTILILEPGAAVIASCVTYETSVLSVRDIRGVKVITLDGTFLHVNPFMVNRNQPYVLQNISEEELESRDRIEKQILGGCTCMENDRFARLDNASEIRLGDILSFKYAGAYTMAFNSDFIIKPAQVRYVRD